MSKAKKLYVLLGVFVVLCGATFALTRHQQHQEEIENSDKTILTINSEDVTALSWTYQDKSYAFHKDGDWIYDDDEAFPVSDDKITSLLDIFQDFGAAFEIDDVEDYDQYGLKDPTGTIMVTTAEETYEIDLGNFSDMDSERYVSIGDGKVYLVSTDPADSYDVELSDLIQNDETPALETAQSLSFSDTEEPYTIQYEENSGKSVDEDDVYFDGDNPVDSFKISSYLSTIRYLGLTDYVTYNATDEELEEYGLDDPELTVTVEYTDEDKAEETTDSTSSYSTDSTSGYGTDTYDTSTYSTDTDSTGTTTGLTGKAVAGDTYASADGNTVTDTAMRTVSGNCNGSVVAAGTSAANMAMTMTAAVGNTGVITASANTSSATEEAASSASSATEEATSSAASATEETTSSAASDSDDGTHTFVLHLGRNKEALASARNSKDEDAEQEVDCYVRIGDSRIVYRITYNEYTYLLNATYNDLRHDEVLTAAFEDITQLDITLDGESYSLTTKGKGSKKKWYYNDETLDITDLQSALTALEAADADSFTDESPSKQEEISVTVHLDNEDYPEIQIDLYRYNGDDCLAVINGESVSLIPRSQTVDLIEAVNAIILNDGAESES